MAGHVGDARFERVPWHEVDWDASTGYPDVGLFKTRAWIDFLAEVQGAEPVIAVLHDGNREVGRFTGLITTKFGMKFLGSPLPGWTTPYMGFNLKEGVSRTIAIRALTAFAFEDLGCIHLEIRDRRLTNDDVAGLGFERREDVGFDDRTFILSLLQPEETLFQGMSSACRRCIRQSEKRGILIEEAHGEAFADEFYPQIRDVFLRQGLVPTYDIQRVKALIRHLEPAGQLLLLRARNEHGDCIATGLFPAHGDTAFFWGGASLKAHQHNRPNEALQWHAMRHWRNQGVHQYDFGGYMDYKRKYGGEEVSIPGFRRSSSPMIATARSLAPKAMRAKQLVFGRLARRQIHGVDQHVHCGESD